MTVELTRLPHLRDVSNWQGPVDWRRERREVVGCYVKVSQGASYVDATARRRIRNAAYVGLPVGGYHYATPGVGSGAAQADRLIRYAPLAPGRLRPCLDCEAEPVDGMLGRELADWYADAVRRLWRRLGYAPTIYGSPFYLERFAPHHPDLFGACPLWVAHYGVASPTIPRPWHSFAAWQHTSGWHDPALPRDRRVDDSLVADLAALRIPRRARRLVVLSGGRAGGRAVAL